MGGNQMASGWFAMSVHALALLAQNKDGYSSSYIAGSVNTHAVFLRRVLKRLVEVGIVETREGRDGGYRLTRPAEEITLAEVYQSLQPDPAIAPSPAEPNPLCPIGAGMPSVISKIAGDVEDAIIQSLQNYTIAQVAERARSHSLNPGLTES
jgi:Rrf2 family transcriptional regulator, repressor of oqxAB